MGLRVRALQAIADCLEHGHGEDRTLDAAVAKAAGDKDPRPAHYTAQKETALHLLASFPHEERIAILNCAARSYGRARAPSQDFPRWICAAAMRHMAEELELAK